MKQILLTALTCLMAFAGIAQHKNADTWRDSANYWLKQKEFLKAIPYLDSLAADDPEDAQLFNVILYVRSELKQYDKAFEASQQLIRLEPKEAGHYINAGWYALLTRSDSKAKYYLLKAISLNPNNYSAYLNLGHVYAYQQVFDKMFYYYQYAVEYFPNKEKVESAAIADLRLLKQMKLIAFDTTGIMNEMRNIAAEYDDNTAATEILDSIYRSVSWYGQHPYSKEVIDLKREFCRLEPKNKISRYHVLSDFYYDIGVYEVDQRNQLKGFRDYIVTSFKYAFATNDTLSLLKKWVEFGQYGADPLDQLLDSAIDLAKASQEKVWLLKSYWGKADVFKSRYQWDSVLYYARLAYDVANQLSFSEADEFEHNKEYAIAASAEKLYDAYLVKRKCDSAFHFFDISSSFFLKHHPSIDNEFETAHNKAVALYKCGNYEESIKVATKAYNENRAYSRQINFYDLLELIGINYYTQRKFHEAEKYFRLAIETYKRYTEEAENKKGLMVLNAKCEDAFEYLKKISLQKGDADVLFSLTEEAKQSIMYYTLENKYYPNKTRTLADEKKSLTADEVVLSYSTSGRMSWGYGIGFDINNTIVFKEDIQQFNSLLNDTRLSAFRDKLNKMADDVIKNTGSTKKTDEDIATAKMGLVSMIFNMNTGGSRFTRGFTVKVKNNEISAAEAELNAMNDLLYTFFVAPFETLLAGKKKIYISAEQSTNFFPFEILKNKQGKYLGEIYNIVYVPSFTLKQLIQQRGESNSVKKNLLAFGNPVYNSFDVKEMNGRAYDMSAFGFDNWSDLPGTEAELQSLQQVNASAEVIQGAKVTESAIKQLSDKGKLKEYQYLHFATHGMSKIDNYEDNALILTEPVGSRNDGFLQFWEIANLDVDARLVCLSACETAISGFTNNNELNLPLAFIMAGARSVIASSWKIDDKATGIFMSSLYRKIFDEKKTPSEALSLTRKEFITGVYGNQYKAPMYWGAFKYIGY